MIQNTKQLAAIDTDTSILNMGLSLELERHIKDPANSVTHAVQMERTPSRGVHSRPTGVPGVPDGFLVDIHHFRTRMNHPGHLRTLAAPLTALPALGYQPGFTRDNPMRIEPISPSCFLENPGCPLRILVDTRVLCGSRESPGVSVSATDGSFLSGNDVLLSGSHQGHQGRRVDGAGHRGTPLDTVRDTIGWMSMVF